MQTPYLNIAYEETGTGSAVILLHGFPDDVRAYDGFVPALAKAGCRALVPYLRGYGPTRFRNPSAPRMAQQAAIGQDVIDFADALGLELRRLGLRLGMPSSRHCGRPSSRTHSRQRPHRGVHNIIAGSQPGPPQAEARVWYQWYFNTERGRAPLNANRRSLCKLLWHQWSPTWRFTDETYDRTGPSFDNPDFVDVVIHSYRHRIGNASGEPRLQPMEDQLAKRPEIKCPTITLYGADDGIARPANDPPPAERATFPALRARRVIEVLA